MVAIPRMTVITAITFAKIGRSIKNRENIRLTETRCEKNICAKNSGQAKNYFVGLGTDTEAVEADVSVLDDGPG